MCDPRNGLLEPKPHEIKYNIPILDAPTKGHFSINGDSVKSAEAHKLFLCTSSMPVWLPTPLLQPGKGARGMGKLLALESDDH